MDHTIPTSEAAIFSRIIDPDSGPLPPGVARMILKWKFSDDDRAVMHRLLEKAHRGKLTRDERKQAEKYELVGHLVSTLKSKARASLRRPARGN